MFLIIITLANFLFSACGRTRKKIIFATSVYLTLKYPICMKSLRCLIVVFMLFALCGSAGLARTSERWTVWSAHSATRWEDAFVTGNGRQGTMVWGNPADERITCVHEELFIRGWDRRLPTVAQTADLLPVVRKWILEGRNDAADSLITTAADNQLRAMGGPATLARDSASGIRPAHPLFERPPVRRILSAEAESG